MGICEEFNGNLCEKYNLTWIIMNETWIVVYNWWVFVGNLLAIRVNIKLNMNYHEWDMNCRELLMEFVDDLMKIRVKKVF